MRRRMTFDEFLKRLRTTKWRLRIDGSIRADSSCDCPYTYVLGQHGVFPQDSDENIGWRRRALFAAADNDPCHNPAIRRRLLEACGLKEQP